MTIQLNLSNGRGVLRPNPKFGEPNEAPLIGTLLFLSDENQMEADLRLSVSAWRRPGGGPCDYVLKAGGGLSGVMLLRCHSSRQDGASDFDGVMGPGFELWLDGRYFQPEPDGETEILFRLYSPNFANETTNGINEPSLVF